MKIFKYELEPQGRGEITVELPEGAKILSIAFQHGKLCLWALVSPMNIHVERHILMLGTGWESPTGVEDMRHISTIQQDGGQFIWHFFEEVTS